MPLEDDDATWLIELESALLDDCIGSDIYRICQGKAIPEKLRPDVWQICLDVRDKGNQLIHFNEIFDLSNQNILREDCQQFVEKLGNEDDDKVSVISDLESILTFYCKNRSLMYETNNGWIELLLPLIAIKPSRGETYNLFEAIRDTYIPKGCYSKGNVFHVFRLLLLYHDPELCSFLDTKRVTPDLYSFSWFQSLFAATCTLPVVLSMWDLYFQQSDPFFVFFLSLIMVVNQRDQILSLKKESKEEVIYILSNMPCALEAEDVCDFCSLAHYYAMKTPASFKTDLLQVLYGAHTQNDSIEVSQALCLPVSVHELVEIASMDLPANSDTVRFFLVDCRPAEQYNAGHLSTAFHLDCNLMLQEPSAFSMAVQGLLSAQRQAIAINSNAGGEHLCFVGSGRLEEDQYTHMVVASFLQKHTQYVSLVTGGYMAIHDYFGDQMTDCLENHNPAQCLVCQPDQRVAHPTPSQQNDCQNPPIDLFGKLSAAMKSKSAEVKGRLYDYIVNPSVANAQVMERHVSSNEKGKRYRNVAPVFSIDEDNDENLPAEPINIQDEIKEIVTIQEWLRRPDIICSFKCQEVHMNGYMFDSHLLVTHDHLIVLRDQCQQKGKAQVIVSRPLSNIVKITAKKRHRDLITFKYGIPNGDTLLISDMDRFLIPNACEATAIISNQIVKQLDIKNN